MFAQEPLAQDESTSMKKSHFRSSRPTKKLAYSDPENRRELFRFVRFEHTGVGNEDHGDFELDQFLNGWFGNSDEIGTFGDHTIDVKETGKVWL